MSESLDNKKSAKEFWNWKYFPKLFVCIKLRDLNVFLFTLLLWASAADHVTLTELFQISTAEENRKWLGLSYIRAVRLRHITAARGPGFCYNAAPLAS